MRNLRLPIFNQNNVSVLNFGLKKPMKEKVNVLLKNISINQNIDSDRESLISICQIRSTNCIGKTFSHINPILGTETTFQIVDVYKKEFFFKDTYDGLEMSLELYSLSIKQLKELVF